MTKGALYRHYKSKRDIFDCIVEWMEQGDSEQAASMTCRKMIKRVCRISTRQCLWRNLSNIARFINRCNQSLHRSEKADKFVWCKSNPTEPIMKMSERKW
mgnify:CR=1 FL=1